MSKIDKALVIGLGSIGKRHLGNLQRLFPHIKVAVLRSSQISNESSGYKLYTSLEAAMSFNPQIAFVCNPSSLHLSIATELANSGVHIFIEKPLSISTEGVAEFVEAVDRAGIKVMVGYNFRFSLSFIKYRELIQSRQYGRALFVSSEVGQYLPDWRPDADYRNTVSARADLGGGALLELSHELDYLIWLFGIPVTACGQLLKVSDLEIDAEDLVLAQVSFCDGDSQVSSSIRLDFLQRKPSRTCKVICEQGALVWDAIEDRVEFRQKDQSAIVFQGRKDRNFTYEQELKQFITCVEGDQPTPISVKSSLKVLELIEALRLSSSEERTVYL